MNSTHVALGLALVAIVIAGFALFAKPSSMVGAVTTDCTVTTCLTGGLRLTSGDFSVVTSNTATSSAAVGCVQTTATSTATPIHLSYVVSNTSSTTFSGTAQGNVMWQYGACPI